MPFPFQPSDTPTVRIRRTIGRLLPPSLARPLRQKLARAQVKAASVLGDPLQARRAKTQRQCPICGFAGMFWSYGSPPRPEVLCPQCFSLERHRLLKLLLDRPGIDWLASKRVLHFAPEPFVRSGHARMARYVAADIAVDGVDCRCAMESLPWADAAFDVVIANHVLEHVKSEDSAFREIGRVLAPGGFAILSVPIIQGWRATYEDDRVRSPEQRRAHFGQEDHRRLYGRDFTDRLREAGFAVETFQMDKRGEVRFALNRGEQLFIARPPGA